MGHAITTDWTIEPDHLHFHDWGFDDYGTEVITRNAAYDHQTDVKVFVVGSGSDEQARGYDGNVSAIERRSLFVGRSPSSTVWSPTQKANC